jgi:hypothetical protein
MRTRGNTIARAGRVGRRSTAMNFAERLLPLRCGVLPSRLRTRQRLVNLRPFEAKSRGRYRSSDQISSPHWHLSIRTVFPVREFSIDLPWIRTAPQRLHVRNGAALTLRAVSASDFSLTSPSSKSTQAVSVSEPVIRNRPLVVTISRSCVRTFSNPASRPSARRFPPGPD